MTPEERTLAVCPGCGCFRDRCACDLREEGSRNKLLDHLSTSICRQIQNDAKSDANPTAQDEGAEHHE